MHIHFLSLEQTKEKRYREWKAEGKVDLDCSAVLTGDVRVSEIGVYPLAFFADMIFLEEKREMLPC